MIPFKIFDPARKITWTVLTPHTEPTTGTCYLAVREDDSEQDGAVELISFDEVRRCRFVGFVATADGGLS